MSRKKRVAQANERNTTGHERRQARLLSWNVYVDYVQLARLPRDSFDDQFEMDAAALVLDAVIIDDVLRVRTALDVDQNVRFDLLEVHEDQRTAVAVLVQVRIEVPVEAADGRGVHLRVVLDFEDEIAIDVVLATAFDQNVIREFTRPDR